MLSEPHEMSRQLRIEPDDTIGADREIRRIEDGRLNKIQDSPINSRPLRFHDVEHEFRRSIAPLMHDADRWIVAVSNRLDPKLAFKNRVGVIQDCVDRVCSISITGQMEGRRTLLN